MTSQLYPSVGQKGFKSKPDVEAYLAAFSADEFDTYFQYYHPDIHVSGTGYKPPMVDEMATISLGVSVASISSRYKVLNLGYYSDRHSPHSRPKDYKRLPSMGQGTSPDSI